MLVDPEASAKLVYCVRGLKWAKGVYMREDGGIGSLQQAARYDSRIHAIEAFAAHYNGVAVIRVEHSS